VKARFVRSRRLLVAAAVVLVIGSAAGSRPQPLELGSDAPAAITLGTPVPTGVMSTLQRACFDCHSDHTRWPWYARLPVASHLIERDVTQGRRQLNWSHWAEYNPFTRVDTLDKVCELASTGKMPPWQYQLVHGDARLSTRDVTELCAWAQQEAARLLEAGS
jgi:hypothetical protein